MLSENLPLTDHLASQTINESGPGSVLADFEVLLDFIGDGVRSAGKYHLLPMAGLFELDERMTKPLRPRLKRPQQKSFPHLNGLYLLLRATQLGVVEGQGKANGRLKIDSAMHENWRRLNSTERYFNLLEAWLRLGSWEALGLGGRGWSNHACLIARELWRLIPATGLDLPTRESSKILYSSILYSSERACSLALHELFGLMTVVRGEPDEGKSWRVMSVKHTVFGDELLPILFNEIEREIFGPGNLTVEFGAWQPMLQPYFPEWVNNLELAEPEFREGDYYFKVSLGNSWRRIAIPAKLTLEDLALCIIRAFEFDGDHLYTFRLVARGGQRIDIAHPYVDDADSHTDEEIVGELPLTERQSMEFRYDFGADWRIKVQLEKIEPKSEEISEPKVVESQGESPKEYEHDDDDEW